MSAFGTIRSRAYDRTPLGSVTFRAVIFSSLLIMMGFGLIVPALPLFATRFGVGEAGVGMVLFVFALTRLAGDLVTGGLLDRYGERTMTGLGAVIVGVSSIAAGAAPNYPALVVLRGFGGVGSAFFLGGLMAFVIGTVAAEERGRAMSMFQASIGIGLLIGPVAGGLLIAIASVNTPLYVYGVICIAVAPMTMRAMGPARVPAEALTDAPTVSDAVPAPEVPSWHRLRPLLGSSTYRAALAATAMAFVVTGALQTLIPVFWTESLGYSKGSSGVPFTVLAVATLAVVWHAGALSDRRGRKFTLIPAVLASGAAILALGFAGSAAVVLVLMVVLGAASGYGRPGPTAMVADVASDHNRGVAVSGYRIAGDVGALIGPVMAGVIAEVAGFAWAMVAVSATVGVALLTIVLGEESAPARAGRTEPARAQT